MRTLPPRGRAEERLDDHHPGLANALADPVMQQMLFGSGPKGEKGRDQEAEDE